MHIVTRRKYTYIKVHTSLIELRLYYVFLKNHTCRYVAFSLEMHYWLHLNHL